MFSKNKSVFYMYAIYFCSMALFAGYRLVSSAGLLNGLSDVSFAIISPLVIQVGIMIAVPFLLHALLNRKKGGAKNTLASARIKPISWKAILLSLALGVVLFFAITVVAMITNMLLQFWGYAPSTSGTSSDTGGLSAVVIFVINVVTVALLPALGEEFLHRGLLLNEISRIGYKKAILISALLFGLMHFNIVQFGYAFVAGLLLALVVVATKSLLPAMIIHFTNNFVSVYLSSARSNGWFLSGGLDWISNLFHTETMIGSILIIFLVGTLLALLVAFLVFELFKETTVKHVNNALGDVFGKNAEKPENAVETHEKSKILREMLITRSNLNLNIGQSTSPLDIILPLNKNVFVPTKYDNAFLTASLVLGIAVTVFSFLWGALW